MSENKNKAKIIVPITVGILALAVGVGTGIIIGRFSSRLSSDEQKIIQEYRLIKNDWLYGNEIEYLGEEAAVNFLKGFNDPYTFYTKNMEGQNLSTNHDGYGFTSHPYDGGLYVYEVHDGPSYGKLNIGDVLYGISVDGNHFDFASHTYNEMNLELTRVLQLEKEVLFDVVRDNTNITVSIKPGDYVQRYVTILEEPTSSNNNTLVVRVNTFLGNPTDALSTIISTELDAGKTINKLVIDLRGNGGGYLGQASSMAKLFVKKNTMTYALIDKNGKVIESDKQRYSPTFNIPKYGIIVDHNSASASEAFTLAMRAGANTTVYGLLSYGKGIAQSFKTFSDGSVVRYTSAYVYGPERENETMYDEGKDNDNIMCIHGKGIIPDITYSLDYSFLNTTYDLSLTYGISENAQLAFLKTLNNVYKDDVLIPEVYSKNYHFDDAIKYFGSLMASKYSDASYLDVYENNGLIKRIITNKFSKVSYDEYLKHYDLLTKEAIND